MKPNPLYAELELIQTPADRPGATDYALGPAWAQMKAHLGPLARRLLAYFCGSQDLRVRVKRDRQGNSRFVAYDPVTQQRYTFSSEQDLRAWADRRYYS